MTDRRRAASGSAAAEAADLRRYAEEVAVAAAGAAQTARRRRTAWLAAQDAVERAWPAYDEADDAARRFAGAGALPTPRTPRTPAEYAGPGAVAAPGGDGGALAGRPADGAARATCSAHRNGWDPAAAPGRAGGAAGPRGPGRRGWPATGCAAERERAGWRDAELAAEAARTLAAEAYAAAAPAAARPGVRRAAGSGWPVRRVPPSCARWRPARVG